MIELTPIKFAPIPPQNKENILCESNGLYELIFECWYRCFSCKISKKTQITFSGPYYKYAALFRYISFLNETYDLSIVCNKCSEGPPRYCSGDKSMSIPEILIRNDLGHYHYAQAKDWGASLKKNISWRLDWQLDGDGNPTTVRSNAQLPSNKNLKVVILLENWKKWPDYVYDPLATLSYKEDISESSRSILMNDKRSEKLENDIFCYLNEIEINGRSIDKNLETILHLVKEILVKNEANKSILRRITDTKLTLEQYITDITQIQTSDKDISSE